MGVWLCSPGVSWPGTSGSWRCGKRWPSGGSSRSPPTDAPTPFALADPDRVRKILGAAGFTEIGFEPVDEPIEFGSDPDDAYAFMRTLGIVEGLTHDLDDTGRGQAMAELQKTIAAHDTTDGVLFGTSAWLITARRA